MLIATGEASYPVQYDHCTVSFLRRAGVPAEHIRSQDYGIRGNGHMMMLEANTLEVAHLVEDWLASMLPSMDRHA